ncbi:MFS general substrate transporter [Polyplosphaeria fusca]|uniref:MFS general substrate transporter n=1 Tax=Polyplosphaeria fusca TaxID=682080 RepID=A0A9P4QS56_9PLEO|nr:MFS general substrate transporter [Polyplosphaeria fusca]
MSPPESCFDVAIVGGGIVGLSLALGLQQRNIKFRIYERAQSFGEIGAGIGFTPNAERAMKQLDPRLHDAFRKVAARNSEDFFNYMDGSRWDKNRPDHEDTILRLYLGERGFEGCRRSDFLEDIVRHVPSEVIEFNREVVDVIERGETDKLLVVFRDGTNCEADVVVGCDGIRSKVRRIMLGDSHPAAQPSYSHKYAIRGLVPMEKARASLGEWRTSNRVMHLGPNAHALTFPVANSTILNVVAFVTDPNEWEAKDGKFIAPASKTEATHGFAAFSPIVRTIMDLLPDQLDKWAVFDTRDHPVPTYVDGRICLAGDAAHASTPHHGAGAGCGIEDCLALAVLLDAASRSSEPSKAAALKNALRVYNDVRYARSQWLVDSSRIIGDVYELMYLESGSDPRKIAHEIETRQHMIWDYDIAGMVTDALERFGALADRESPQSQASTSDLELGKKEDEILVIGVQEKETSSTDVSMNSIKSPGSLGFLSGFKLYAMIGSFTVVYFLMMLDMSILSTAIPYITDEFHSLVDVGWYGSAYQLVCASLQPLTGKMYARLNSKVLFLCFFTIFEIGSALCGAAQSSTMLIIGRTVAGIGGAGLMNGGFTILNSCVEQKRRPGMLAFMMAFGNLGAAAGPLIGGAITEYASWRWCFYINLPVGGVLLLFLTWVDIPDHIPKPNWKVVMKRPFSEFDLIGFALFAPATIQAFLALEFAGNSHPWNSAEVIGLFCGAAGMLVIFSVWNYHKGDAAMIPVSILKLTIMWASCCTIFLLSGTVFVMAYYLPLYFQGVRGDTPYESGVHLLPTILPQVVFTLAAGRLVQRFGYYLPFILAGGAFNSIGSGLLTTLSPSTSMGKLAGYQIISGTGRGLALPMPMVAVQNTLSPSQIPTAMSTFVFCQNFGGALMTVLAQTVFTNSLKTTLKENSPSLDADSIIAAGSTEMRNAVPPGDLRELLRAYSESVSRTFWLATATAITGFFVSYLMGWRDIRRKDMKAK